MRRDDTAFLAASRTEDYATAFRSKGLTPDALNGARLFLRLSNPDAADLTIREKIETALRDLASESAINREKVRDLGVNLDIAPPVIQ